MLIHFLLHAGLPYLTLRTAIRSNNSPVINKMYMYMINFFRATNKFNYAKLCVFSVHMSFILKPELREIWDRMRTASLRGHVGRNVGWDFTLEIMNLEVATMIGTSISGERIQEAIRQLNDIRHVKAGALDAFGIGEEASATSSVKEADVLTLVHHLKQSFRFDGNDDASKLYIRRSNQFKTAAGATPQTRVAGVELTETRRAYVTRMVRISPRNTML